LLVCFRRHDGNPVVLRVLADAAAPASLGRLLQWLWTATCASRFANARAWSVG